MGHSTRMHGLERNSIQQKKYPIHIVWVCFFHHIVSTSRPYKGIIDLASSAGCLNPHKCLLNDLEVRGLPLGNNTNSKLYYHW